MPSLSHLGRMVRHKTKNNSGTYMELSSKNVKRTQRTAVFSNMAAFLFRKKKLYQSGHVWLESIKLFTADVPPTASSFCEDLLLKEPKKN